DLRLLLYSNKMTLLMVLGRPAEAEQALGEALVLAERAGTARLLTIRSKAANINYCHGRWDDALVEIEIALELLEDRPINTYEPVRIHGLAALIAAHRGDRAAFDSHVALLDRLPPERAAAAGCSTRTRPVCGRPSTGTVPSATSPTSPAASRTSPWCTASGARCRPPVRRTPKRSRCSRRWALTPTSSGPGPGSGP